MTHTLETTAISRVRRPRAAAERGPDRGDRARPRHRAPAVRARGRGGARRGAARALRPRLPPQRAVARATRRGGSTSRAEVRDGILNHTGPDEPETLEGRIVRHRRPRRVHQPRHRRRDPRSGSSAPDELPRDEIELLGADRLGAHRHARPRPRRDVGRRAATSARATRSARRCCRCARSCSSASTSAREHARASTSAPREVVRAIFDAPRRSRERRRPGRRSAVTDYVAGMTDRFALAYAERL